MPLLAVWDPDRAQLLVPKQTNVMSSITGVGRICTISTISSTIEEQQQQRENATTLDHGRKADLHSVHDLFNNQRTGWRDSTKL